MNEQPNLITPNYNQPANLPNATATLVLGIISIVGAFCYGIVGVICGIIGLILANKDRKAYRAAPDMYNSSSYSTSNSGRICSLIGLILGALFLVIMIFYFIFFGTMIMDVIKQSNNR
ncbi:MAG: CCC motif membrane protein [Ferruginibacter sp.]